jgi:hypothetical protein
MDDEQLRHVERLHETSLRRLRVLEQQAASFGLRTPPRLYWRLRICGARWPTLSSN